MKKELIFEGYVTDAHGPVYLLDFLWNALRNVFIDSRKKITIYIEDV